MSFQKRIICTLDAFQYENAQIAYPKDTGNRFKELDEYAQSEVTILRPRCDIEPPVLSIGNTCPRVHQAS